MDKQRQVPLRSAGPTAGAFRIYFFRAAIKKGIRFIGIHRFRETYAEARYFTYGKDDNKCFCKPEHNLDDSRRNKNKHFSGNVMCEAGESHVVRNVPYLWT